MLTRTKLQEKASEAGIEGLVSLDPTVYCKECGLEFEAEPEYTRNPISKQPIFINQCLSCGHLQVVEIGEGVYQDE